MTDDKKQKQKIGAAGAAGAANEEEEDEDAAGTANKEEEEEAAAAAELLESEELAGADQRERRPTNCQISLRFLSASVFIEGICSKGKSGFLNRRTSEISNFWA